MDPSSRYTASALIIANIANWEKPNLSENYKRRFFTNEVKWTHRYNFQFCFEIIPGFLIFKSPRRKRKSSTWTNKFRECFHISQNSCICYITYLFSIQSIILKMYNMFYFEDVVGSIVSHCVSWKLKHSI